LDNVTHTVNFTLLPPGLDRLSSQHSTRPWGLPCKRRFFFTANINTCTFSLKEADSRGARSDTLKAFSQTLNGYTAPIPVDISKGTKRVQLCYTDKFLSTWKETLSIVSECPLWSSSITLSVLVALFLIFFFFRRFYDIENISLLIIELLKYSTSSESILVNYTAPLPISSIFSSVLA
jgi:hypothetical protein